MKNRSGFTLIELLAVIVILALLMAVAIPSVTKYIETSRKETVVDTIGGYISSITVEINNRDYQFSTPNTIYAVPLECIELERGGDNPFGEWLQANSAYWAYVLIEYDSDNFSYNYGFTFKDSAGYGLYPTLQDNISKTDINVGYDDLSKPESGDAINFISADKWNGFNVTSTTQLVVLESESEGNNGNGKETCTLCQMGENYAQVEEAKEIAREEAIKERTLIEYSSSTAFWNYKKKIKTITFQSTINIPNEISDEHKWDVSTTGNGKVMAYIIPNASNSSYYDLYIQGDGQLYANPNSSQLFAGFSYLDRINNIEILNTSNVTNMDSMFSNTGYYSTVFTLDLGNNFDTSNVTNMRSMFCYTGYKSIVFTLDLGDKFDTSNVTDMFFMFMGMGYFSTSLTLDLGDKFDTSNVTNMYGMFSKTGYWSSVFTLDLGNNFDTSKVTDMSIMFEYTGRSSTVLKLDLGDKFDTSNVTSMYSMFLYAGGDSSIFTLDLGDKFDTSKVTDMTSMFSSMGFDSTVLTIDLGDKFDTSNVTNMYGMFQATGYSSSVFTLDLGDKFDTSKVMNMTLMFENTGYKSSVFKLDCSKWNVDKVTNHTNFNYGVTDKVTSPTWVN